MPMGVDVGKTEMPHRSTNFRGIGERLVPQEVGPGALSNVGTTEWVSSAVGATKVKTNPSGW